MGLITGIRSRDGNDISELLYKMAVKLRHRGNSQFCVFKKGINGWKPIICKKPEDILNLKLSFGIVGRHFILDSKNETIPYSDCHNKNLLLLDGRIFNIEQISQELENSHRRNLDNSGVILHYLEELQDKNLDIPTIFKKIFSLLEGMFATILIYNNNVFIFRDLIGIKPLYLYNGPKYIAFASEKKALWNIGLNQNIKPLNPGRVVQVTKDGFILQYQAQFNRIIIENKQFEYLCEMAMQLLRANILKLSPLNHFYLLMSGGIDSSLLAALLKNTNINHKSIVIGREKSKDIISAKQVADFLDIRLEVLEFDAFKLEKMIPLLIYCLESREEKKLNIAFPLFYASKHLQNKDCKVIFTGQGADELFGGYERHEIKFKEDPSKVNDMLWNDIENLYLGNLQRDDVATMANTVEIRLPYLSRRFIEFTMQIPPSFKIKPPIRKYILRHLGKKLGLSERIIQKPKRAIQFSSGSYDILKKLARTFGFTKDFALKNRFFSPTQLFIDSIAFHLGFPNIDPKIAKFLEKSTINLPDSIFKYKNIVNKLI